MARQTFPDNTIFANDAPEITQPEASRWATGYESGTGKTPPSAGVHNYEFNRGDQMLQHIEQNGVPVWDARTIYAIRGWALGSDGMLYRSRVTGNTGNDPVGGDGTYWISMQSVVETPLASESEPGRAEIASQAETDSGVADDKIVTPKKLRFGISSSLGTNGYLSFPSWLGGVVIQWGQFNTGSISNESTGSQSFPVTFPSACYQVICGSVAGNVDGDTTEGFAVTSISRSSFSWTSFYRSRNDSFGAVRYFAIGR